MKRYFLILSLILLTLLGLAASSVSASSHSRILPSGTDGQVPGNYCVSCHQLDDPRLATVTAWNGSIDRELNSPCPAATTIHEELYYTERLLLMIERASESAGPLPESTQARLDRYTQRYNRLLDAPVTSVDAFESEAQSARFQINKAYAVLNQMAVAEKQRTVIFYSAAITLIVLASLAWGLFNTRAVKAGLVSKSWATFWRLVFIIAVLGFFTLPIFRVPAVEVLMTSEEEQAAQATLDTAQRAADAADRAQARAWMLARVGTAWGASGDNQARDIFEEALAALDEAQENENALWGQSLAVQEVTVGDQVEMETAGLIAADLNAARARAWALPLIALEVHHQDTARAIELLEAEQQSLEDQQSGPYRDLQLRGLALAWETVDPARAVPTAARIADPALRAWTLRELAVEMDDASLYDSALQAANEVADPVQRARAIREIAQASGQTDLFDQALAALDGVSGAKLAYALSDLAAASGNPSIVDQIDPAYPEARTSALLRLGDYRAAWEAALQMADPYEKARAQAAIAAAWENADAAAQITVPSYRDRALRDVIRKTGEATLVDSIASPYYKVQALTSLGDYEAGVQLASELGDDYPLVDLGLALAKTNPESALALVDEMTREADKAILLREAAAMTLDPVIIERAQGMALAARIRGDALAPAQASLELANALLPLNVNSAEAVFDQAYQAAQRITTK